MATSASVEARLVELGLRLPPPPPAIANAAGAASAAGLVFVSGHGPYVDGRYAYLGKVDSQVSVDEAYDASRITILNALASLRAEIGSLDKVRRVVKLLGMVNSDPDFGMQPKVIDGASDLIIELFGEQRGRHARSAIGVAALPLGIAVEIELIVEV